MDLAAMKTILDRLPGHIGFYLYAPDSGETLSVNADDPIEAASVIKLFIMAEAMRQQQEGLISLDERITVQREDALPSCGALSYMTLPVALPIRDLVTLMIILSDNTATNLLIDRLGADNINALIGRLGLTGTRLNRKLFMEELARKGVKNTVSAGDLGTFFLKLLSGQLIGKEADDTMLSILKNQRLNGKMPFYLHDRGIRCAHKTGEDDGITHDVGIIYGDRPVIFCFLSEATDVPAAEKALMELARLAVVR